MVTTVEISMYPFRENYRDLIQEFVAKLREQRDLRVATGPTSTVVIGENARVMGCLRELIEWSHDEHGQSVFVAKILAGYDPE